mmetsp:Transcript_42647/g.48139  ORF Transcript_42647/g.48139 Transcript_42647/m.48139 type:complete len:104 (+) Transcript_42647:392-703(+)
MESNRIEFELNCINSLKSALSFRLDTTLNTIISPCLCLSFSPYYLPRSSHDSILSPLGYRSTDDARCLYDNAPAHHVLLLLLSRIDVMLLLLIVQNRFCTVPM